MPMRGLTIGKLAGAAGVHLETIRYYERIGLMPEPGRTTGGYRSYGAEHARRLSFIRRARELGFGIEDIKALLALAEPGHTSCADVKTLTMTHLDDVRAKILDPSPAGRNPHKGGGSMLWGYNADLPGPRHAQQRLEEALCTPILLNPGSMTTCFSARSTSATSGERGSSSG